MKYAIFSDSHDHMYNMEKAINMALNMGIKEGIHLGDFCAPPIFRKMLEFPIKWTCVWGNVDGAKAKVILENANNPNFDISDEHFREVDLDGKKVFLVHFPLLAENAAKSGKYDAVFFGDDHDKSKKVVDNTLLANPGEISGTKTGQPSFGIYDSDDNSFEIIDLDDFKVAK